MPKTVGQMPASSRRELRTAVSTAVAAWAPTRSLMAAEIWPLAASSPNTIPTIATTMITSGASENSVQKASAAACSKASRSSQRCPADLRTFREERRCMTAPL
jgi:hypothetical protein